MSLVTEFEAGDKWCPFGANVSITGIVDGFGATVSSMPPDKRTARCIGSSCMAWRWGVELTAETSTSPDGLTGGLIVGRKQSVKGYCGAFGKVEP